MIVLILEGSGFYETARRVCNDHTTIPVLVSHHCLIVSLDAFPVHQVLDDYRKKRDTADEILRFRRLNHDLRSRLTRSCWLDLVQTVQCPADMEQIGLHINILPTQSQEFSQAQSCE